MNDLAVRAQKLIDALEDWIMTYQVAPPRYVLTQIEQLKAALERR